jgi:hypothetical protein
MWTRILRRVASKTSPRIPWGASGGPRLVGAVPRAHYNRSRFILVPLAVQAEGSNLPPAKPNHNELWQQSVRYGSLEVLRKLMAIGYDPNSVIDPETKDTALHLIQKDHSEGRTFRNTAEVISTLLRGGANPLLPNAAGETAIDLLNPDHIAPFLDFVAETGGDSKTVDALLLRTADSSCGVSRNAMERCLKNATISAKATTVGLTTALVKLLQTGTDGRWEVPNLYSSLPPEPSWRERGTVALVEKLLALGADPNGETPDKWDRNHPLRILLEQKRALYSSTSHSKGPHVLGVQFYDQSTILAMLLKNPKLNLPPDAEPLKLLTTFDPAFPPFANYRSQATVALIDYWETRRKPTREVSP